jgi:hypothetical protein
LLLTQVGQLLLGLAELLHQPAELVLAAVGQDVQHLLELVPHLLLILGGLTHLVLFDILGRLAHLPGRALLASLVGGIVDHPGRQRIGLVQLGAHLLHLLQHAIEAASQLRLPLRELFEIGLLLRREVLDVLG